METKFELKLDKGIELNSINTAAVLCISNEYLIDLIRDIFKENNTDGALADLLEEFVDLTNKSYNVAFSNFDSWNIYKSSIYMMLLNVVKKCDDALAANEVISAGQIMEQLQNDLNEFVMSLGVMIIDHDTLDLNGAVVKQEYIDSTLEQLSLMNESYLLCAIDLSKLEMTPVDMSKYKNDIIEKKINNLTKVTASAKKSLDDDYLKIIDLLMSMSKRFYDIVNEKITDGEKAEAARKVVKDLAPHVKLLDKLENKLTKGNELKRQLKLNKKKLVSSADEELERLDGQIKEDPNNADIYEGEQRQLKFATQNYAKAIDAAIQNINDVEEEIAKRYKMLDLLQSSLKSSIPTEGEMNKLSAIPFKFQELANKQENAKSTISDKNIRKLISTTITGLQALSEAGKDLKDLYMRNTLVSATFKTSDVILDFAESNNKGEQLQKMLILNKYLERYAQLSTKMTEDFFNCRKIANDAIRNIALTMCQPYTPTSLEDISNQIEVCYTGMDELIKIIDSNNKEEIKLIEEILSLVE